MAFTNATKEAAALAVTGRGNWISVHTGDPGATGANEATGGGYARAQTTWAGGGADGVVPGSQVSITLPAAAGYECLGVWTAATGGTFVGALEFDGGPIGAISEPFTLAVTPSVSAKNPEEV